MRATSDRTGDLPIRAVLNTTPADNFDSSPKPGTRKHLWQVIKDDEPVVAPQAGLP